MSSTITPRRRAGYTLGILVGLTNIPGMFVPGGETASGSPTGPPLPILVFDLVAGLLIVGLLALSWRNGSRGLVRAAAVVMILVALTAVPAFFAPDIPLWIVAFAGIYVLATVVSLLMLFAPEQQPAGVGLNT